MAGAAQDQQQHDAEDEPGQPADDCLGLQEGGEIPQAQGHSGQHPDRALEQQPSGAGQEAADHRVGDEAAQTSQS